jgi:hypothetical protein
VATDDREEHPRKSGRVKRLYDRLASILRRLTPDRRQAAGEYLDEQAQQEENDDGGRAEGGDRGER